MAFTKAQWSWLLYDPANAAYALIVRTVFAPVFFLSAATAVWGEVKSTEYWGYTASLAGICAGIFSLATGNYADLHHKKKLFLGICAAVSIITTIILPFTGHMPPVVILVLFFFSMYSISRIRVRSVVYLWVGVQPRNRISLPRIPDMASTEVTMPKRFG